ncbi:hypothetical protein COO60DRAFT_1218709 [Scenedesmus sp. NREL 46B-D3]|nr:hypothetical protein COO60DRAFT_1218709 [Scenedesmus sp. NREL 46B-D3]
MTDSSVRTSSHLWVMQVALIIGSSAIHGLHVCLEPAMLCVFAVLQMCSVDFFAMCLAARMWRSMRLVLHALSCEITGSTCLLQMHASAWQAPAVPASLALWLANNVWHCSRRAPACIRLQPPCKRIKGRRWTGHIGRLTAGMHCPPVQHHWQRRLPARADMQPAWSCACGPPRDLLHMQCRCAALAPVPVVLHTLVRSCTQLMAVEPLTASFCAVLRGVVHSTGTVRLCMLLRMRCLALHCAYMRLNRKRNVLLAAVDPLFACALQLGHVMVSSSAPRLLVLMHACVHEPCLQRARSDGWNAPQDNTRRHDANVFGLCCASCWLSPERLTM